MGKASSSIFSIIFAKEAAKRIRSNDPVTITQGMAYFINHAHAVQAVAELPAIVKLMAHEDADIRQKAVITVMGLSWDAPSLIREHIPAIAKQIDAETNPHIKSWLIRTLEPVAKEDDVHLLKDALEGTAKNLTSWDKNGAARVLRAVNRRAPDLIQSLSAESQELLKRHRIGTPRRSRAKAPATSPEAPSGSGTK